MQRVGLTQALGLMNKLFAFVISIGAAALPAAFSFAIYQSVTNSTDYFPSAFFLAGIFASAHAFLLGTPAVLGLMHFRLYRPTTLVMVGAIIGVLPLTVFSAINPPNYWQDPVFLFSSFALLGAAGALVFYIIHRAISPNNSFKPTPLRGAA